MNVILEQINSAGNWFVGYAAPMLVQSSVLIAVLLLADLVLRRKVRAVFRYWLWMLILVKLILPTSLSSPVSLGHLVGNELQSVKISMPENAIAPQAAEPVSIETANREFIVPQKSASEPAAVQPKIIVMPISWQGVVFLVWLAVVMGMGLLLVQRAVFVCGLVAQAKEADSLMNDTLKFCCGQMGMKGRVGLKISANATSPAVCGLFRPVILVPENLGANLGVGHLRMVLLHELAHIKRGDLWVNLVQTILQIIYFYNPLLWLANAIIRRIREQAVDEMVQVALGDNANLYPQTLLDVAKLAFRRPVLSLRLLGVVESKSALKGRIKRMLDRPLPKSAKLGALGLAAVLIVGAVLLPMAKAAAVQPEFVIKGTVTDAKTGQPVAGAKVGDNKEYNNGKFCTVTDSNGNYEYKTWYEEHNVVARIEGYLPQEKIVKTKLMGHEKERILDFELSPEKSDKRTQFKTALPNGVTVELVGICEHPSEGKQWWKPDGTPLAYPPYNKMSSAVDDGFGTQTYEFAFLLKQDSNETDMGFKVNMPQMVSCASSNEILSNHELINKMAVALPEGLSFTDMNVGTAAGKWKTMAERPADERGVYASFGPNGVSWMPPVLGSDNKTTVTASYSPKGENVQIIATDKKGNTVKGDTSGAGFSDVMTFTATIPVPLSEIAKFQLQTRPYEWVKFKNVSLKPGNKTDVQVEVSKSPLQTKGGKRFGAVIENVLPAAEGRSEKLLDIDTGSWDTKEDFGENDRETHKWVRDNGLDLLGFFEKEQFGLLAFDMAVLSVKNTDWERLTAEEVVANWSLAQMEANKIAPITPMEAPDRLATYLFRTRENGIGILQIVDFTDNPKGVKIRYKIVEGTDSENPNAQIEAQSPSGQVISASDFDKEDADVERQMVKATAGQPEFVIKGTVTDAETGQPIAGAKVGDVERYAEGKQWTTTDANGNYSYKTWYEEHDVKCEASGYKTQNKVLLTKLLGSEKEKVIDFAIESENTSTGALNESQKLYARWTEERFGSYLDRSQYANLSDSTKAELEGKWLKLLEEPENEKYYDAINGLVAIKSKKAIKPLLRIATERIEKDNRYRWMTVRALGIIGDESVVPELIPLVYHYNQNTRFWAQISLVRLTGENFGADWQKWAEWWNSQKGKPACSTEKVEWTSNPDWADPEKQKKMDEESIGRLSEDKKEETGKSGGAGRETVVVSTTPAAYAEDVSPDVDKITVTFDQPMVDRSWSWTGGGETYPKTTGEIYYDSRRTTCTLPVKLEAGKVYWVGINSPSYRNFKSADGVPAKRYVILFATKGADGKPTPIPEDMLAKAKSINEQPERTDVDVNVEKRRARLRVAFNRRIARDKKIYSEQELDEIEELYQVANKKWQSQEAQDSLEKLIAKYGRANRTGCAILYLGQMSEGEQKEQYLKQALDDFSDCMYGNGVRVGAFARYLLAMHYEEIDKKDEAKKLIAELIKDYPDAVGHKGGLLIEQIPEALLAEARALNEQAASTAQPTEEAEAEPTVLAREFVGLLVKEDFSAATETFDATMKAVMPPQELANAWKGLLGQSGAYKKEIGTRTEKLLGFDIVYVTCEFEKGPLDIKVVYNSKRQVSGLWFVPVPQEVLEGYPK